MFRISLVWCALLALLLVSCATAESPDNLSSSSQALCEQAAAHVDECFGTGLDECNADVAARLLASSCEEILDSLDPTAKADGFCPSFLWWLCGEPSVAQCPSDVPAWEYEPLTSAEKMAFHWERVECTEYTDIPALTRSTWTTLSNGLRAVATSMFRLGRAFTNETDFLDYGRRKMLHPYGSVAQVEWVAWDGPATCGDYTGLFAEDQLAGLARLGWGADPGSAGYIPGMALKFFIEGGESVNLHVIHSLDGDPDAPNFFSKTLSNVIPQPSGSVLSGFIRLASYIVDNPLELSVADMAAWTSNGDRVVDALAPSVLVFEPTQTAYDWFTPGIDFRIAFSVFPAGTHLYDVVAVEGDCRQNLGSLYTTTAMIPSEWGDNRLHFQHQQGNQGL